MPETAVAEQEIAPVVLPDRRTRRVIAAILGLSFIGLIYVELTKPPRPPTATATAQWDDRYPASNAADGDNATDWILPDNTPGTLDLRWEKAKKVARIKVTNARNPPYFDRGAKEVRVEAMHGEQVIKNETFTFNEPNRTPDAHSVEVSAPIDRVRITVLSHYLLGGGIAEVELESR